MTKLILYSTSACHLCELAEAVIAEYQEQGPAQPLRVEKIDIANSDPLLERYGIRIPVVAVAGRSDDLGWPFDSAALTRYLAAGER